MIRLGCSVLVQFFFFFAWFFRRLRQPHVTDIAGESCLLAWRCASWVINGLKFMLALAVIPCARRGALREEETQYGDSVSLVMWMMMAQ
jgi:hypothetical protein